MTSCGISIELKIFNLNALAVYCVDLIQEIGLTFQTSMM